MEFWVGLYVTILTAANLGLMVYIFLERYHAFKKEGEKAAQKLLEQHFEKLQMDEQAILEEFRSSIKMVVANTQLAGQQTLQQLNEYVMKAHTEHTGRFNEFSAKLYSVLVESGNHFTQQLQQYSSDSNKRIDDWQTSYIEVMKHEVDMLIDNERQKLLDFTDEEKRRITQYIKEQASRETSVIVEEVLGNRISVKDQERLAQQAIEKFFREV
jgi:F0F1-type ATP synthase membrane subunit b/b'